MWLQLERPAQFVKSGFAKRKVAKLGFVRLKAERWELIWLGLETLKAGETASVWLSLGKLAQFVKLEFEFEFGRQRVAKSGFETQKAERWEPI